MGFCRGASFKIDLQVKLDCVCVCVCVCVWEAEADSHSSRTCGGRPPLNLFRAVERFLLSVSVCCESYVKGLSLSDSHSAASQLSSCCIIRSISTFRSGEQMYCNNKDSAGTFSYGCFGTRGLLRGLMSCCRRAQVDVLRAAAAINQTDDEIIKTTHCED